MTIRRLRRRTRAGLRLPAAPHVRVERELWRVGHQVVAGVDEVGRGALAGPLVAAAVALPREPAARARLTRALHRHNVHAMDSKLLSPADRETIDRILIEEEIPRAIVSLPAAEVDQFGVGVANQSALRSAIAQLDPSPSYALVDAFGLPDCCCEHRAIVKGDCQSQSIAFASIIAKVYRDRVMVELDALYPGYHFADHKGYGTLAHRAALEQLGPIDEHRRSFSPVARLIEHV